MSWIKCSIISLLPHQYPLIVKNRGVNLIAHLALLLMCLNYWEEIRTNIVHLFYIVPSPEIHL